MKNKIKFIGLFLTMVATYFSCEDVLTDEPQNKYTEIQVFSTEEGVETAVNGIYSQFQGYDYYGARMRLLLWPHSGKYHSKQGANDDANRLNILNTNLNLDKLWRGMWQTINQANIVIKNVEGNGLGNETSSLGQAYFLRGHTYFDLARIFEEVPIRLTPTTSEDIHIAKSTKEEVYNQVISDFKKAAELLPDRGEYIDGRPLKYAANAYLSKVYMFLAGQNDATIQPSNFNPVLESEIIVASISNFWEEAKSELDYVINNGGYTLTSTYAELWEQDSRNTSESIFELQYGHTGAVRTNDIIRDVLPTGHPFAATGTTLFGRIRPNKEMFTDHVRQYSGQTFSGDFIPAGNNGAALSFDENITDPRIDETYIYNSYIRTDNGKEKKLFPIRNKGNDAYAQLAKYKDLTYDGTTTIKNIILMRYAEVLLLRAEVENEINGPTSAIPYVNQVLARARTRSSGTTTQPADWDISIVPTKDEFRERIMKEREYELNGEGHEWFDMRRRGLGRFQEQIDHHNAAVDFYGSINNRDFIFENIENEMVIPIPLAEISGNNLINE